MIYLPRMREEGAPRTREECRDGCRPCQWSSCRYHLSHHEESCALDVADQGEHTQVEVAKLMGITQQRVATLERKAINKAAKDEELAWTITKRSGKRRG